MNALRFVLPLALSLSLSVAQNFELTPVESFEFNESIVVPEDLYEVTGEVCDSLAESFLEELAEGDLSGYACYYVDRELEDHEDYIDAFNEALEADGYSFIDFLEETDADGSTLFIQFWEGPNEEALTIIYVLSDDGFFMFVIEATFA